jgi:hypothetical protein
MNSNLYNNLYIDSVFGKYNMDDTFINWYQTKKDEIKELFLELLSISDNNNIDIDNNDINFNSFIIMLYHESYNC